MYPTFAAKAAPTRQGLTTARFLQAQACLRTGGWGAVALIEALFAAKAAPTRQGLTTARFL